MCGQRLIKPMKGFYCYHFCTHNFKMYGRGATEATPVSQVLPGDISDGYISKYLIYLFGVLGRFQHCTGHITTGSWKGRGNQYIQTTSFPTLGRARNQTLASEVGGECYHSATVAPT